MTDLHVTSRLIVSAQGAAAGHAPAPETKPDAALAFSAQLADALNGDAADAAPQEAASGEPAVEQDKDKTEDARTGDPAPPLGLPIELPRPAPPSAAPAPARPSTALAALQPEAGSEGMKAMHAKGGAKPAALEQDRPADQPAALSESVPLLEARHETVPQPAGHELLLLAQVQEPGAAHVPGAARPALPVAAPVGSAQWREEFSAAVRVIATEKIQSAELQLNPPELGPVRVSLRIESNEASIAFFAPHADTRQALEAALPRLREVFDAGGIALGNASIDDAGSGTFGREQGGPHPGLRAHAPAPQPETAAGPAPAMRALRLVDVFA